MTRRRLKMLAALALLALVLVPREAAAQGLPAAVCATLRAERAKYGPAPTDAEAAAVLNATAWTHRADGWGLSGKEAGGHCPMPGGRWVACDILHRRADNLIWDVLYATGGGGPASPVCGDALGPMTDPSRPWVAPVDPGGGPPEPPAPDLAAIAAAVKAIQAQLETLAPQIDQARAESFNAAVRALATHDKLDALLARPICQPAGPLAIEWPVYRMRSPWGIGTFLLKPDPPTWPPSK